MERIPEYKIDLARQLRQRQTQSEAQLWSQLRSCRLQGLKFRRQHPLGRFISDFCCEKPPLVIEIDGGYHDAPEQAECDKERAAHLTGRGYRLLRFPVEQILQEMPTVLAQIRQATSATPNQAQP